MIHRSVATHFVVLVVGVAGGVGTVAVADSPRATTSATDTQAVNELRKLNTKLDDIKRTVKLTNKSISGYDYISASPSLADLLQDICRNTRGDSFSGC